MLFRSEFIIAARPGYSLEDVAKSLPEGLRPTLKELRAVGLDEALRKRGVTLHLLPETHEDVSATQIRAAMRNGKGLTELVPEAVAEYIQKEGLYKALPRVAASVEKQISRGLKSARDNKNKGLVRRG